jgi:subtilase family serine protease
MVFLAVHSMYNRCDFLLATSSFPGRVPASPPGSQGEVMLRRFSPVLLTAFAVLSILNVISVAQSPLATRHVREVTVNGQAPMVGRLPATQSMRLVFVLPLRNQDGLRNLLQELYDPSSPNYRHFLTVEEFTSRFGPTQEDYDAVIRFVESNGLRVVGTSRNRVNLDVRGSVSNIEQALHITLGVYRDSAENRTFFAPDREPTPSVGLQLWHITGLDNYSIPRPLLVKRGTPGAGSNATTGSCPQESFCGSDMRAAYYGGTLTGSGQSLGLLEYYGTDLTDLDTYYTNAGQTNNVPITLLSTDGTSTTCTYTAGDDYCDDTEQTIDMTQALGMAPGLSSLVMYVGSSDSAIFNAMATASPLNAQLSCSWGWTPADPSTDDVYFKEFAAQGQNLFAAAGDSGEWSSSNNPWPADSEYLVSVGGTDLTTNGAGGTWASETVWSDGGGGISPNDRPIPSWQVSTAEGCGKCSQKYRNGPDVSANANFTYYVCADQEACTANYYGGTSFAAPLWAGYLALLNEQGVANGNSTLGFLNPSIYPIGLSSSYDTDFHDITSGSNGYPATVGYDLASGWGSPNGGNLITALAGPAGPGFTLSASPNSISIGQGSSGTSTITSSVTGGFSGSIALSSSGAPSGVTVSFNPASITAAGTSTMTIAVGPSVTAGTYSITVTGTSGSIVESATVTLTVTKVAASFTISVSPTTITIAQGASGTVTVTTTSAGSFDSAITLTASGEGDKQTVTFSPNPIAAPGSGTSTMTIQVGSTASIGNKTVTITGKGDGKTEHTTLTLTIVK